MVRLGLVAVVAAFARTTAHKESVCIDAEDPFSNTSSAENFDFLSQSDVLLKKSSKSRQRQCVAVMLNE